MLQRLALVICAALLTACAPAAVSLGTPSPQTITTAPPVATGTPIAPTPAPASATPRSFSAAEVVIDPNILDAAPLGLTAGVPISQNPGIWPLVGVPGTSSQLSRQLLDAQGEFAGWITLLVYQSLGDVDRAYQVIQKNTSAQTTADTVKVGDAAHFYSDAGNTGLAAKRCHLVANIFLKKDLGAPVLESYANDLLSKLASVVCEP